MEVYEAIGFTHFWGITPAIDFLNEFEIGQDQKEINVLLSGTSDIRHILKTIADNVTD